MDEIFKINGNYLDEDQRNIVLDRSDALLVIAGAGSGKTFTILGKIKYLINKLHYKEKDILCISLTNDTVNNLKEKLLNLGFDINVLTFHKLGLNILKEFNKDLNIVSEDYLNFIIDEYFLSYVLLDKKRRKTFFKYLELGFKENFLYSKKYSYLKNLINTSIHLIKNNNIKFTELLNIKIFFNKFIFKYILDIYLIYMRELEGSSLVDFDDMIINAIEIVNKIKLNYKYIIIDEYQDTSIARYRLIKAIVTKEKCKLMAVGDDWQSIYKFTGCELSIFLNFKNYFETSKVMYMGNTYRNSQHLINIASSFIKKNPYQVKKDLKSHKKLEKPIKIVYEKNKNTINKLIEKINSDDLMILGRNNYDIKSYNLKFNIKYLTVHKSKGLEAEKVILINLENKIDGFPNKKKEDKILNKIAKNVCLYPYDEERRLFYVALTRTKNEVYLLVRKHNMSIFVKELIKDYKDYIEFLDI